MEELKAAASVRSEMSFQVHDFFTTNPVSSGDVYFLRHILHDWGDDYAIKILRNISSVMKREARIVVMDIVVPPPGSAPWQVERMIRYGSMPRMFSRDFPNLSVDLWISK
jgi:6-hydroxytryprostatin B O-methyltransferase